VQPSSKDLHPATGARFVFDRESGSGPALAYVVTIYLPGTERWSGRLTWVDGRAQLDPEAGQATRDGEPCTSWTWAFAEALKLARVLHRDPKQHMVRWRGSPL
jgi:hypothetical protein